MPTEPDALLGVVSCPFYSAMSEVTVLTDILAWAQRAVISWISAWVGAGRMRPFSTRWRRRSSQPLIQTVPAIKPIMAISFNDPMYCINKRKMRPSA